MLPDGEAGGLGFTSLTKEAFPVIRYRTRDLTRLLPGTARPGMRRMEKITGRSFASTSQREGFCRVTRVDEPQHLRASHIKPWREATDAERLDGANGLLLSPHVDHLFDKGYITFSSEQRLLVVTDVRQELLDAWGIDAGTRVGVFNREQNAYLDYHRANVFDKAFRAK